MKIKTSKYQTLFNAMWTGLSNQGWKQSIDKHGGCAYRGAGKLKCAIGHCIDDKTANLWEHHNITEVNQEFNLEFDYDRLDFLDDCQCAHDGSLDYKMEDNFRDIAKRYNLTIPGE